MNDTHGQPQAGQAKAGPPPSRRWLTAPIRALRYLNEGLLNAGEAMVRSDRFPQSRPRPHPAEAKRAHPAPVGKVASAV